MTHVLQILRSRRALFALIAAAALAAGCGGGTSSGVGGGGTGGPLSFSRGPISGFGSVIVNGVHFDDSAASVTDDDGNALSGAQRLRLGTVVEIEGGAVSNNAASATTIRVHVDLVGPVTAVFDSATGRLAVLGQPVRVVSTTVLDGFSGGAAAIAVGSPVAVSALYDRATGVYVATRIDPATSGAHFAIRGTPSAVDTTGDTFTIGGVVFSYGSLVPPSPFVAGELLRAVLAPTPDSKGRWVVTSFSQTQAAPPEGRSGGVDDVVGSVTDATHFVVDGVAVDASNAMFTPIGATVGAQARVVVQGTVSGGVLVATAVHVRANNDDEDDHDGGTGGNDAIELDGAILALDTAHQTFTMRGPTTVSYATASFAGGTATGLAVGVAIEVHGNLSADGTEVTASSITFR